MKKTSFNQRLERLSQSENRLPPLCQDRVLNDIRQHKCHIVTVPESDGQPGYTYSTGLWHNFEHPEIITFGLPESVGEKLIDDMQKLVKVGQPPVVKQALGKSEDHYPVELQPIEDEQWINQYLPLANWFYARESFPVLEILWN